MFSLFLNKPAFTSKDLYQRTVALRVKEIEKIVTNGLSSYPDIRALDAGCGSKGWFSLEPNSITGIDISQEQLDRATHIDEKIKGDIQHYDLSGKDFDLIICMDVIEHLEFPKNTIEHFYNGLKEGGMLILATPNYSSLWAQVTRLSPHWFHLFYYRYILGSKHAGKGDRGPFKTVLDSAIAPNKIKEQWQALGGSMIHLDVYEGHMQNWLREILPAFDLAMKGLAKIHKPAIESSVFIVATRGKDVKNQ